MQRCSQCEARLFVFLPRLLEAAGQTNIPPTRGAAAFQHAAVRNFCERRFAVHSRRNLWSDELLGCAALESGWRWAHKKEMS